MPGGFLANVTMCTDDGVGPPVPSFSPAGELCYNPNCKLICARKERARDGRQWEMRYFHLDASGNCDKLLSPAGLTL